jgi:uncharacterized membrane protein YqhA
MFADNKNLLEPNSNSRQVSGMKNLQDPLEKLLFGSRWFLAPMYLGLVIALLLLIGKFGQEFWHTLQHFVGFKPQMLVIAVLEWMGTIDYSGLKQKIIGSVVAISSIELLKLFIDLGNINHLEPLGEQSKGIMHWRMAWMVGLHGAFVASGLIFALTEKVSHPSHPPNAGETVITGESHEAAKH